MDQASFTKMKAHIISSLAALLALAAGCQSGMKTGALNPYSLAGNDRLPEEALRYAYTQKQWQRIIERPYDGYVILRGKLDADGHVVPAEIIEAWPDGSRNEMARDLCGEIQFDPLKVGSNIRPIAEVYAVFYEAGLPHVAYVFGKQVDTVGPTNQKDFNPSVYTHFY
jgi:hypothetical protein